MQAANDELKGKIAELAGAARRAEELQAANEELQAANKELKRKIAALEAR